MSELLSSELNPVLELYSMIFFGSLAMGYLTEKLLIEHFIKEKSLQLLARTWVLIGPSIGAVSVDYFMNKNVNILDFIPAVLTAAGMAIGRYRKKIN